MAEGDADLELGEKGKSKLQKRPEGRIKKVNLTGKLDLTSGDSYLESLPDKSKDFWTDERLKFAGIIWDAVSGEMNSRFGVIAQPFNKDVFYVTDLPKASGCFMTLSGRIALDKSSVSGNQDFAKTLAHEMGHFYARRTKLAGEEGTSEVVVRQGLRSSSFTQDEPRKKDDEIPSANERLRGLASSVNVSFSIFDEAVVEETMMDVLHTALSSPENRLRPELRDIHFGELAPGSYPEAREALHTMIRNIRFALQSPSLAKRDSLSLPLFFKPDEFFWGNEEEEKKFARNIEQKINRLKNEQGIKTYVDSDGVEVSDWRDNDIFRIFQHGMWGSVDRPAHFGDMATLINYTYGHSGFKTLQRMMENANPGEPKGPQGVHPSWPVFMKFLNGPSEKLLEISQSDKAS